MTRKEAIKALKWFKAYNEEDYCGGDRIKNEHGDWYYHITEQDFEAFDMAIKALEQEPRWIPISEKLPDKNKYDNGAVWERSVLVTAYFSWDSSKHTFISTKLAEDVVANNFVDECIVAWMPLPKPYEPRKSEDNE